MDIYLYSEEIPQRLLTFPKEHVYYAARFYLPMYRLSANLIYHHLGTKSDNAHALICVDIISELWPWTYDSENAFTSFVEINCNTLFTVHNTTLFTEACNNYRDNQHPQTSQARESRKSGKHAKVFYARFPPKK